MNATVNDLMVSQVMTTTPTRTLGHVKQMLNQHHVSLPVVNDDNEPVGIVSAADFLEDRPPETPISQFMTTKIYTVPQYADVSLAARSRYETPMTGIKGWPRRSSFPAIRFLGPS